MADLTKFRQTDIGQSDDFYANYITRDGVNMLANLTNLAIFMQIPSRVTRVELTILTNFSQIRQEKLTIFVQITFLGPF